VYTGAPPSAFRGFTGGLGARRPAERPDNASVVAARIGLAFGVFGFFWGGWGALLPEIKSATGATDARLGWILLFIAAGALPGMLAAGRVADRRGSRALTPALLLFAGAALLPAFVTSTIQAAAALVVVGVTSGGLDVVINAAVAAYEAETRRRLMGLAHAGFSGGVLAGAASVGMARNLGAGRIQILLAVSACIVVVAGANRPVSLRAVPPAPRSATANRPLLVLGLLCALAFLIEDGLLSWSAIHLEETLGASPLVGGLGPASLAAAMVAGRALVQWQGAVLSEKAVVGIGGVAGTAGALVVASAPSAWAALVGVALTGAAIAACAPSILSVAGRVGGPGLHGWAIARVTTVAYIGFIVGPPLVGGVAGVGGLRVGLAVLAAVSAALAAGARWMP
jgi:MFS family permease